LKEEKFWRRIQSPANLSLAKIPYNRELSGK
jgi:hypothetical protein